MRKYFTLLLMLICGYSSAQQRIAYTYDLSGIRVNRQFHPMRMSNPSQPIDSSAFVEKKFGISVFPNPTPDKIKVNISLLEVGESAKVYLSDDQEKILLKCTKVPDMISYS